MEIFQLKPKGSKEIVEEIMKEVSRTMILPDHK